MIPDYSNRFGFICLPVFIGSWRQCGVLGVKICNRLFLIFFFNRVILLLRECQCRWFFKGIFSWWGFGYNGLEGGGGTLGPCHDVTLSQCNPLCAEPYHQQSRVSAQGSANLCNTGPGHKRQNWALRHRVITKGISYILCLFASNEVRQSSGMQG